MKILAKAAFERGQIQTKIHIGTDGIEIQLLEDYKKNPINRIEALDIIKETTADIYAIHMPLPDDGFELQNLFRNKEQYVLHNVCSLAHTISNYLNHRIIIVIHLGMGLNELQKQGLLVDITNELKTLQDMYPLLDFCFENIIPVTLNKKLQSFNLRPEGYLFEGVDLVRHLRNQGVANCGTVFDICHALITLNFFQMLECENLPSPVDSLDTFFEKNKDVIKLMHLSSAQGLGYVKDTHGIPYSSKNKDELIATIGLYNKYKYTCPVTLEVFETDFLKSDNYRTTKAMVETVVNSRY